MDYTEVLPEDIFSRHVESYWHLKALATSQSDTIELLLPTCTFNIVFIENPCYIKTETESFWIYKKPGAYFLGQRNKSIHIKMNESINISGIRFKPFAFANIFKAPIFTMNDAVIEIDRLFEIDKSSWALITKITNKNSINTRMNLINDLMLNLFKNSLSIDERLRAQLNYILDRKGAMKVSDLFEEFNTSKVTLRKHFINKVGLTPKKVSQIWRMNYILQMKKDHQEETLTSLCFKAGFYDQAHFIKDFKLLFGLAPRKFFHEREQLVKFAHHNISKRFTNQYDPRIIEG